MAEVNSMHTHTSAIGVTSAPCAWMYVRAVFKVDNDKRQWMRENVVRLKFATLTWSTPADIARFSPEYIQVKLYKGQKLAVQFSQQGMSVFLAL